MKMRHQVMMTAGAVKKKLADNGNFPCHLVYLAKSFKVPLNKDLSRQAGVNYKLGDKNYR